MIQRPSRRRDECVNGRVVQETEAVGDEKDDFDREEERHFLPMPSGMGFRGAMMMKGYELRGVSASISEGWPEYVVIEGDGEQRFYGPLFARGELDAMGEELSDALGVPVDLNGCGAELRIMALRYRDALARNEELRTLVERKDKQIARLRGLLGL